MAMVRWVAAVAAGLALLAGCSGGFSAGGAPMPEGVPGAPQEPDEPQPSSAPGGRLMARTASVTLVVPDVEIAAGELQKVAAATGGLVTSENLSLPGADEEWTGYSQVVVSVPAEKLDEALGLIGALGEIRQRSIESVDVTDAVLDVDARVKSLRESIARLQELMSRAGSVADIAAVEAELSRRQAELESLLAQQKNLQNRVAMSPISVALYPPELAVEAGGPGFLGGLMAGWATMVTAGQAALTLVGWLIPWVALAAIVGGPLLWWRRRHRAAKPSAAGPASAPPGGAVPPQAGSPPGPVAPSGGAVPPAPGARPAGPTPPAGAAPSSLPQTPDDRG